MGKWTEFDRCTENTAGTYGIGIKQRWFKKMKAAMIARIEWKFFEKSYFYHGIMIYS